MGEANDQEKKAQPDSSANVRAAPCHGTSLTIGGRKMKKLYLATVCFMPPLLAVFIPIVFLAPLPFRVPAAPFPYIVGYFWIGFVWLFIDLWRSRLSQEKKALWTVLNLFLGLVTLPVYWFLVVRKEPSHGSSHSSNALDCT